MEDFRDFLDNDLRAGATDAVRLPAEDYERLLANNFLDYSLEELLEIGRRVHEETRQNLDETARMIDPTKSWLQTTSGQLARLPRTMGAALLPSKSG